MKIFLVLIGCTAMILSACDRPQNPEEPDILKTNAPSSASNSSQTSTLSSSSTARTATLSSVQKPRAAITASATSSASAATSQPLTEEQWRERLTEDQYAVLREKGTETPYTSPLLDEQRKGTYYSVDCNQPVFRSEQKFDSGTGWPSFWAPIEAGAVTQAVDAAHGMARTEILSKCGGHLGHVFNDGPEPTGLRYCINGLALRFVPDPEQ